MNRNRCRDHETELLILCGLIRRGEKERARIKTLVKQGPDWDRFLQRSVRHKLYPLVFKALSEDAPGEVPPVVLARLRSWVLKNAARNERLCRILGRILEIFEANSVDALMFKGPLLSEQVYGSPFFRVCSDLDILVRKDQALKALELFACQGFTADFMPGPAQAADYLENENFFRLTGPDEGDVVDLHWEMSGKYGLVPMVYEDLAGVMSHARFMERTVKSLGPSILGVYLCIHNASHLWDSLESVACLAGIFSSPLAPDGRNMMNLARKYRARRILLTGLRITEIVYQVKLPRIIQDAIGKDRRVDILARRAVTRLLEERAVEGTVRWSWRFSIDHLLVRDTAMDALHYAFRLLFRPTVKEWMYFPGHGFRGLRFALRPLRLVREAFRGAGFPIP